MRSWLCDLDPISTIRLGLIQRLVSRSHQRPHRLERLFRRIEHGQSDRDGHGRVAAACPLFHMHEDALAEPVGCGRSRVRRDNREFVASPPCPDVGTTQRVADGAPYVTDDAVTGFVSLLVVDVLEIIDVDEQQRERRAISARDRRHSSRKRA